MKGYKKHIDINTAMSICLRNGIKVYPVINGRMFQIEVDDNGKITKFDKLVDGKSVANAQSKTYRHYALLILEKDA